MNTSTTTKLAIGFTIAAVIVIGAALASFLGILTVLAALSALPSPFRPKRATVAMERKRKQRTLDAVRREARAQKDEERQARNRAAWQEHDLFTRWQSLFSSPEVCARFEAYCDAEMEVHRGI